MMNSRSFIFSLLNFKSWFCTKKIVLTPQICYYTLGENLRRSRHKFTYFCSLFGVYISYKFFNYVHKHNQHFVEGPFVSAAVVPPKSPSNLPRETFNFVADVAEKISPSVVYIEIKSRHPITQQSLEISNGSGFFVKPDGLILTNAHVVANHSNVTVKLHDGREFRGTVEDKDTDTDLATVRINAKNLPVLPLGKSSKLRPGEFVIAMGNPLALSHTITVGVVSSTNRPSKELGLHHNTDYIQTDAAINVGNSGGPLVNLDGEAIGINTIKVTEGISFAIPSDAALEFLKKIEEKRNRRWNFFGKSKSTDKVRGSYIGITMLSLTPEIVQELHQRSPDFPLVRNGVLVWKVNVGSPAHEGGIKPGDIITNINKTKIYSASDVYKLLLASSGEVLNIQVIRGSEVLLITVHPQESPL